MYVYIYIYIYILLETFREMVREEEAMPEEVADVEAMR
jgi:hypothetical protein